MKSLLMYELKKFYSVNKPIIWGFPLLLLFIVYGERNLQNLQTNPTIVWLYLIPFHISAMPFLIFGFEYDSFCFDGLCANSKDFIRKSIIVKYAISQVGYVLTLLVLLLFCENIPAILTTALFFFGIVNYWALSTFFLYKKRVDFHQKRNNNYIQNFISNFFPMMLLFTLWAFVNYYASLQKIIWGVLFVLGLLSIFWLNFVIKKTQKKRYELMEGFRE